MKKRPWFHCSSTDHGDAFVAARRPPILQADGEVQTPRLCVSPNIAACFAATLFEESRPVHVYRTRTPRRAVMPVKVWDQIITQERWLIPPVEMVRVKIVDADTADRVQVGARLIAEQRQRSSVRKRIMQYARAIEEFGAPAGEVRAIERIRASLGLTCHPDDYFLECIS